MYGAEVDCVDHTLGKEFQPPDNFVEIKTTHWYARNRKLQKWWCQSHLAGIPRILAAYRDNDGFVNSAEIIETESIPQIAARNGFTWKPRTMIGFLEAFLTFVQKMVKDDNLCYCFEGNPEREEVRCSSYPDRNFIPDWYKKHIDQLDLSKDRARNNRD